MVAWATNPGRTSVDSRSRGLSEKLSVPFEGRTSLAAMRKRVVLPEPLRPAKTTHSPGAIARVTLRRARRLPYRLSIFSKRIPTGENAGGVTGEPHRGALQKTAGGRQKCLSPGREKYTRRRVASPFNPSQDRARLFPRWRVPGCTRLRKLCRLDGAARAGRGCPSEHLGWSLRP